ncbi:hypothetical protein IWQ62_003408 [Dispira parvispora]|uniref:DNA/RNA-binding protein Kin17 WH-like domain-containing protein n=1 Tax=Dispira parvispora TaxID=1520584 RepID=A0A9W8APF3_9FUNG|nr:hypothetical protein IWQ62_003408 [Dispira parvispora]
MGKADFNSPKAIANRIKAKGLQKLRWYCQMCQKQCRDANGFKCHCQSESHQRQMSLFAEDPQKYIEQFSTEFLDEYVQLLSRRYNTQRVAANQVYQELIADRHHLHMNATKWDSLTDFVKHLGRQGIARVDETPRGWYVAWVDNSPEALERQATVLKKQRATLGDEEREQRQLQAQIERAHRQLQTSESQGSQESQSNRFTGLQCDPSSVKIRLDLKSKTNSPEAPSVNGQRSDSAPDSTISCDPSGEASSPSAAQDPKVPRFKFGKTSLARTSFKKPTQTKGGFKDLIKSTVPTSKNVTPTNSGHPLGNSTKRKSALEDIMQQGISKKSFKPN